MKTREEIDKEWDDKFPSGTCDNAEFYESRKKKSHISKIRQDDIDGLVEFFAGYEKPAEDDYDGGYSHALSDIIAHLKALKEKI
jgi:hypothetical protein